eukprot:2313824-Amphidinium_carterae.1
MKALVGYVHQRVAALAQTLQIYNRSTQGLAMHARLENGRVSDWGIQRMSAIAWVKTEFGLGIVLETMSASSYENEFSIRTV